MRISGIYMISSRVKPTRQYIGSAVNIRARLAVHVTELKNNYHHSKKLQRHVNKYGIEDLQFEVLEPVADKNKLLIAEQSFLDMFNPYFNSAVTAGSNLGKKFGPMPDYHKRKISEGNKGKVASEKTKELRSIKMHKYTLDGQLIKTYKSGIDAQKEEGIRIKGYGGRNVTVGGFVWVSDNQPLPDFFKLRERLNECRKVLCKPVIQIDKDGNVVREYEGIRIAYKETGIDHRTIAAVAAGRPKRKTAGGYYWKYKDQ